MTLSPERACALARFGDVLQEHGAADVFLTRTPYLPPDDGSPEAPNLRIIAALFRGGEEVPASRVESLFPREVLDVLLELGLIAYRGTSLTTGPYRLVRHLDLFLFCDHVSPRAKFYYGPDSLAL